MTTTRFRIGQIVPSSNTTMETEIPAMLLARQSIRPERFTFHSSRMRMKTVSRDELAAMDGESDRDRKSTRLNSSHGGISRMPSSA